MKAKDLRMEELLEFRPDNGEIFLKGTRTLVFNADALGILRKDIIRNLGLERAKGFVIRWGWNCGYNDALSIKEQFEWDNALEWITAGPVLLTLEGHTKVVVDEIKISGKERTFLLRGEFINSIEVKQYLSAFGLSESTVCWHLIGYASGYATAFFGEPVYYKEITCRGKGDAHCTFVGKTLAEWGDEIASELPYYEENKISEELEAAYERIQHQNRQLIRAFDIHKELTDLVLDGEGLTGITRTLSRIIEGEVFLVNPQRNAFMSTLQYENARQESIPTRLLGFLEIINQHFGKSDDDATQIEQKRSIRIDLPMSEERLTCLFTPVIAGKEVLGYLGVVKKEFSAEVEQDLIMTIERATTIYALEILKQKAVSDLEQKLRGDFLDSLLSPTIYNENSLVSWGRMLGHDITKPHHILAMDIEWVEAVKTNSVEKNILKKNEVFRVTSSTIKRKNPSALCVNLRETVIILLPKGKMNRNDVYQSCLEIKQTNEQFFSGIMITFGIGNTALRPTDYFTSYQQALEALNIVKGFGKSDGIQFFEELGSLAVLLEVRNKDRLKAYMLNKLEPLLIYESHYHTELISTLKYYLEAESIRKAAVKSTSSVSGLKYRLNKIKELGYDLQSHQERFDLQLALKIYEITR